MKLPANKQVVYLLFSMCFLFGGIAYYAWKTNQREHQQIVNEKALKLDTCESKNIQYLKEIEYWKDSLYSEKVKCLNKELEQVKSIKSNVDLIKKDITKTNTNIQNTQHKIITRLKHEK